MRKRNNLVSLLTLLCALSRAHGVGVLDMASPKLREFLHNRPAALECLTNALSEAFSNRTVNLYYFYSDDDSTARAFHSYPNPSVVSITIRENQKPLDEFICLMFEVLNSEGENHFQKICSLAQSGDISRSGFAKEMLKTEFEAVRKTRDLLWNLHFSKRDISGSYYYERFVKCPDTFKEFLSYSKRVSPPGRDPIKEFELKYDSLRKQ